MNEAKTKQNQVARLEIHALLANVFPEQNLIKHNIGESVYLKTDTDQSERIVTGISIRQAGISYALSCGTNESWHYDFEITKQRDVVKATSS